MSTLYLVVFFAVSLFGKYEDMLGLEDISKLLPSIILGGSYSSIVFCENEVKQIKAIDIIKSLNFFNIMFRLFSVFLCSNISKINYLFNSL